MANTTFHPELAGADPCKFCGDTLLFFTDGAVNCDRCQACGPFIGNHFTGDDGKDRELMIEAVRLWNLTPDDDWSDE